MKLVKKILAGAAIAAAVASAQASIINVGGVQWDPNLPVAGADKDFTGRFNFNQWFAGYVNPTGVAIGTELLGTGEFNTFNGTTIDPNSTTGGSATSFCPGCELTFNFGGLYTNAAGSLDYTNAYFNIYVGNGSNVNYNNSSNPLNIGGASDGNLWLSLQVATLDYTPIGGNGFANGVLTLGLNAVGGLAQSNFDTNTIFGLDLGSSASAQFAQTNITGGTAPTQWVATSSGQVKGDTVNNVPEPASIALLGLGLVGIAASRRRKQAK